MKRDAAGTVTMVVSSQIVHFLTYGGIALLLPLIREDLGISFAQAGVLSAASTVSYALVQIPAGYFSDRYGAKRLFFIGLLGWSMLSLAFAAAFAYWIAVAILFVAGAFRALLFAPGLTLVSSWFSPDRRATAMGIFLVGTFIGTIAASL
ncbi:MAG: MFS transporter, partial [Burkholderiales bacterium]